jgi:hypothetical protein
MKKPEKQYFFLDGSYDGFFGMSSLTFTNLFIIYYATAIANYKLCIIHFLANYLVDIYIGYGFR